MRSLYSVVWTSLVIACIVSAGAASGQNFPDRPIRFVTGGVGGNSDFSARIISQGLSAEVGRPVIVENRAGAAIISGQIVSKAIPDGYTLLLAGSTFTIGDLLTKAPYPYHWEKDFSPVTLSNSAPNIFVVHPSVAAKSVKELIALAKAKPGELNYSTGENGSSSQIAAELFKYMAGVKIQGIRYSSGSLRMADLVGGRVQMEFVTVGAVAPHIKSGKLRVLAVTSAKPSALMPGVPTVAESGVPGYESVGMTGILAPAKTPASAIKQLHQHLVRALAREEVKQAFYNAGSEPVGSSPQEYAAKIRLQRDSVAKMIQAGSIVLE
jgi:tripartite-type tricarboxylate transporter receptor subunit TctC